VKLSVAIAATSLFLAGQSYAASYVLSTDLQKTDYYQKVTSMIVADEGDGAKLWINTAMSSTKTCLLTRNEIVASGYTIGELQLLGASSGAKDVVFDCYQTKSGENRIAVKTYFLPRFDWTTEYIAPVTRK